MGGAVGNILDFLLLSPLGGIRQQQRAMGPFFNLICFKFFRRGFLILLTSLPGFWLLLCAFSLTSGLSGFIASATSPPIVRDANRCLWSETCCYVREIAGGETTKPPVGDLDLLTERVVHGNACLLSRGWCIDHVSAEASHVLASRFYLTSSDGGQAELYAKQSQRASQSFLGQYDLDGSRGVYGTFGSAGYETFQSSLWGSR